ncbi:MAG: reactive intermediate/imine deaminase [marine bacterium B5-7]|nr:MAG: reactive intermediate/imine deaminase [marine bacterium B5-7]
MKIHNPPTIAAPASTYSHAIEIGAGARWLTVSGQIGKTIEGNVAENAEAQAEIIWDNITHILKSADMSIADIVKMTAYLVDPADLAAYGTVRTRYLGDHRPASTLVYVSALVIPGLKLEVEVQAAKV